MSLRLALPVAASRPWRAAALPLSIPLMAATSLILLAPGCARQGEQAVIPSVTAAASAPSAAAPQPSAHAGASLLPKKLPTTPKEKLRRLVRVPSANVGKVVTLNVLPPNAHHINGHGPNWLALYDTSEQSKQVFAVRSDAILSGALVLPELTDGHRYRLQGTLYYCTDDAGQCLMQSHDQILIADSRDASQLDIALRAP